MIWLVGSKGMLGTEISKALSISNIKHCGTDIELDITNYKSLEQFTNSINLDWIINCAAYTTVDQAEQEEDRAKVINVTGVNNLALISKKRNSKLIHFSTDYVFDGSSSIPYSESDIPNPQTIYGQTKLAGEQVIYKRIDEYFIFRISWLYGAYGSNFVNIILKLLKDKDELKIINDQFGSPTYTKILAKNIVSLVQTDSDQFGIYHYSDEGKISWFDFANQIKKLALKHKIIDKNTPVFPISSDEYVFKTKRPTYSLLDKTKAKKKLNFQINNWIENLEDYLINSSRRTL
jgi:dTDP-4-dehydrorhamnose reductase